MTKVDFPSNFIPQSVILAESVPDFGRFDTQTNFNILRNKNEVLNYFKAVQSNKTKQVDWIDFDSITSMHQLTPNEISELLYLFHAKRPLKSAFFYKLQNNYLFLTLPNGLHKVYYRHVIHFYPRFLRAIHEQFQHVIYEGFRFVLFRSKPIATVPLKIAEEISPLFASGLKVNFVQAIQVDTKWRVPLNIIEDELTLLNQHQLPKEHIGAIIYDTATQDWTFERYNQLEGPDMED